MTADTLVTASYNRVIKTKALGAMWGGGGQRGVSKSEQRL